MGPRELGVRLATTTFVLACLAGIAVAAPSGWLPVDDLPIDLRDHISVTLLDGRVFVMRGGPKVYLFDPSSKTFSVSPNDALYVHGFGARAVRLNDGRVLVVGGWSAGFKAEIFDPVTGLFSSTATDLNRPHALHTLTVLQDGRVLVVGGRMNDSAEDATAEIFDPATGSFSLTGTLRRGRDDHAAALLPDGRVLVVGGGVTTQPGYGMTLHSAELFDPATGTFTPTGSMSWARTGPRAVSLPDGKVLVVGWARNTAEVYEPSSGRFRETGGSSVVHDSGTLTPLPDGRVLLAGGARGIGPVVTEATELYWPDRNAFSRTVSMNQPRQQHSAALLLDGRVLVSGGYGGGSPDLTSAELFTLGDEAPPYRVTLGPTVPGGRIEGRVVDATTGLPIPGVFVNIYTGGGGWVGFGKTAENGEYYGDAGLEAGDYYVVTSNTLGYVDQVFGGGACAGCNPTIGSPVTVDAETVTSGVDFFLTPGPQIRGTVTAADTGEGIAWAWVEILNAAGGTVSRVVTDTSGAYSNGAGLPPGDYYVRTQGSRYVDELYPDVPCKFGCDYLDGDAMTVIGSTDLIVDFVLDPGAAIRGSVVDAVTAAGLGGVTIELWSPSGERLTSWISSPQPDAYSFQGLPDGRYYLRTSNSLGYVNEVFDDFPCLTSCDALSGTPLDVVAGGTWTADFGLELDSDDDGDGIFNTIDRNAATAADEAALPSNDFNDTLLDGRTVGTVSDRGGWTVEVADLGSWTGASATLSGSGFGVATLDTCPEGDPERTILDTATESVSLTCNPGSGSTTAEALYAAPLIQLRKPLTGAGIVVELPTAHAATLGSPVRAGWQNLDAITVRFLDATETPFGSFSLDAGESVDAQVAADGTAQATVLSGTVTVEVRGEVVTLREGESQVFAPPDDTPPVITAQLAGTLGANEWYVSNVVVSWTVEDQESSVTATTDCDPTVVDTDTAGVTLSCTATSAGGTASASVSLKRDATPPTIVGTRDPARPPGGWNNTDVVVSFTCEDALSGVETCTPPRVVRREGARQSRTGWARDAAGNSARVRVGDINIDKTAPVIRGMPCQCLLWPPDGRLVKVARVTARDRLSGLRERLAIDVKSNERVGRRRPDWVVRHDGANRASIWLRRERLPQGRGRIYRLHATVTDRAGNEASIRSTCTVPRHHARRRREPWRPRRRSSVHTGSGTRR